MNDVATEGGQSYVALASNMGVDPANDVSTSGGNWALMAAAGTTNFLGTNTQTFTAGSGTGADCTIGTVVLNISPQYATSYLPADGSVRNITDYATLAAILGTTYGGDGTTTFGLPNLSAAAPNNTLYLVCALGEDPRS